MTSLDHAMWVHKKFRADEWLLFDMKSVRGSEGRGLNTGFIYNQKGELVFTAVQEALIRFKDHVKAK